LHAGRDIKKKLSCHSEGATLLRQKATQGERAKSAEASGEGGSPEESLFSTKRSFASLRMT
jgi:hypothetical protein